ncbi:MAG: aminopeptidase P N-terminal domain-containing protein [Acidimicrobiia bacterium]
MSADVFSARRDRFTAAIGDGVALIAASPETTRNRDVEHPFRQDSDFYYLTGFDEPDAVALLDSNGDEPFVLFVRPKDKEDETWTGVRAGAEGAKERFSADAAFPIRELESQLLERLQGRTTLYYRTAGSTGTTVNRVLGRLRAWHDRTGKPIPIEVHDPGLLLAELRMRKTPEEVHDLRHACEISVDAHLESMRFTTPGRYEYQVKAALEYVFRTHGSSRNSYPSIVAGGENACILHYTQGDRKLQDGDLLLVDAGAEYGYQSADITRTFPVNGRFSAPQRAIYDVVLTAHSEALAVCGPGSSLREVHEAGKRAISEGLIELGLVPRALDDTLAMHLYREYFMHGTSHWLGIDVHDVGTFKVDGEPRPLEPGMTFTVEPGIYVTPKDGPVEFSLLTYDMDEWSERRALLGTEAARKLERQEVADAPRVEHPVPAEFHGIGARVEDDILILPGGNENLTARLPTLPDDVEAVCGERSVLPVL